MSIKIIAREIFFSKLFTFVFSVLSFVFLTTSLSPTSFDFFTSTGTAVVLSNYSN